LVLGKKWKIESPAAFQDVSRQNKRKHHEKAPLGLHHFEPHRVRCAQPGRSHHPHGKPDSKPSAELSVGTNEVAKIVSLIGNYSPELRIEAGGVTNNYRSEIVSGQIVIAGPARLRLLQGGSGNNNLCTVVREPESFPPDKTLIIPADTGGANIIMEGSTDLIHWTNAVPGVYTNLTGHMFFRIRAERIP
jgi:hypothetical protein